MQITEINASSSINIFTGENWIKVNATCIKDPGETDEEAFEKLTLKVDAFEERWKQKRLKQVNAIAVTQKQDKPVKDAQSAEFNDWKHKVELAPTKEDAEEIIKASGNWAIALQYQTKELVNSKPNKK